MKPTLYMMVGLPYSGKSHWIYNHNSKFFSSFVYSTDAIIEEICSLWDAEYSDHFKQLYPFAESVSNKKLKEAIALNRTVFWDQTNLTKKSRERKLANFDNYHQIAVVMPQLSAEELDRRMKKRQSKVIPFSVLSTMKDTYEEPSCEEGFDEIVFA